ncbi:cell division ATP-binding protein FtsE [Bifidobacterium aemilianum]|uniref:Cell division ATP-binding protein FtsE n=1 Tax=Bifidobacterium aemilianum TaxID=2493120 RepID=A0A366K964_9BIFI|nr:cell division ATP-binding protein FtsE [Bifidobacterium aemilianum]RBP98256.1 cell division ATP-binding protein FtsE [Bifidobacterium aemilianum]
MALITLDDVSKIYPKGSRPALDHVNLQVNRGDFVFLVGASGSGKTTLLSLLLHEEEATDGEIRVAGNDLRRLTARQVPNYRRGIGFIFQDYKLLNNKTVWQNVAFALEVIGTSSSAIKSLVPKVLQTVGLTGKESNYPHELSGGEAQRVAIARAYVNHPQILLADEPTGNLDPTTSLGIMEVLDAINRTGTTIVMATHNEEIVNSMRKRVVELHNGSIVRDQEKGSYDSALFFPDAEVESKVQEVIASETGEAVKLVNPAATPDDRAVEAVNAMDAIVQAMQSEGQGDEGIARLAGSVHSGRTGRYGQVFQSVETTMTWGKGLSLDDVVGQDIPERESAGADRDDSASDGSTTGEGKGGGSPTAERQARQTGDEDQGSQAIADETVAGERLQEPAAESTAEQDLAGREGSEPQEGKAAPLPAPTQPPAPPVAVARSGKASGNNEHQGDQQ